MRRARHRVEVITDVERLRAFEPEWQVLFASDPRASPFQSPDWLLPWSEVFAGHGTLRVVVLWEGARAMLCLPLQQIDRAGQRRLGWLGEGLSDYLDLLVTGDAGEGALQTSWAVLRELAGDAEQTELTDLPENSPLLRCRAAGWSARGGAVCPKLEPGDDAPAFERQLPAWLARNLRNSQRRLGLCGTLDWRLVTPADASAHIQDFFVLHGARWRARGEPGVLDHPGVQAFHRAAAPRLIAHGLLELQIASWAGRAVAAAYTLVRRQAYLYLNGFDPGIEGVSLGSLAISRVIQRAIADGRRTIDFLRGQEAYKYAWGARDTRSYVLQQETRLQDQAARGETGSASPSSCWRTSSA
jgi:CelD/BcsL family acetyltransferase involved in cellulose biosynthesis